MPISLCMIVKNEEKTLVRCLDSAKEYVDEIIIVDTGSSDKTKEIASRFTNKIYDFKWIDDFSAARNFALSKATKEWIFVLDADEACDKGDMEKIRLLSKGNDADAYKMTQRNYTNDKDAFKFVPAKGEYSKEFLGFVPVPATRLFRRSEKIFYTRKVHETVDKSIEDAGLLKKDREDVAIHHLGEEKGITKEKQEFYLKIALAELDENPNNPMAHYNVASTYENQLHDYQNALKHMFLAHNYGLNPEISLIGIAGTLIHLGRIDDAIKVCRYGLSQGFKEPLYYFLLGKMLFEKKEHKEAKEILNEFIKSNHHRKEEAIKLIEIMQKNNG